jgi:hypothetical protein
MVLKERLEDARANESWLYWFGGDRRIFNFEGSRMLGRSAPTTLSVELLPDPQWLELRGRLDPSYQRLAFLLEHPATPSRGVAPFGCRRLVQIAVAKARADAGVGLRTDSYGGPNQPAGVVYPVETRVSATDSAHRVYRALDSTRQILAPDTLHAGSHLTGYVELPVPPGQYRVGTALFQPGKDVGGSVLREGLDLRLPGSGQCLSDLVLGRQGAGLAWSYRGGTVLLNPFGAFPRTESAEVYYELSGLTPGRTYVTSMELAPAKGGRSGENIRLRFTQIAEGDELTVRRSLGLDRLKRGQYRLSVEISEEGSARQVRREQYLTVSD